MAPSASSKTKAKADLVTPVSTKESGVPTASSTKKSVAPPQSTSPLVYTPLDAIPKGVQRLTKAFHETQKTHGLQFRLNSLRNIYFAIKDNEDAILAALQKDFYRAPSETKNLELVPLLAELLHTMASLHKWVKPEKVTDLPIALSTSPTYIERIPLGVVLVITPFNYPLLLSVASITGAIAAGNSVVFKPSELTPHFSQLLSEILTKTLDPDVFFVVNGGIPETTAVLDQKFDKIMYTGNSTVGTIIAKKAAETLTPVLLELGGKSPAFVLDDVKDSDLPTVAKRIVWGRFTNAGQTCVAVDYVLVSEKLKPKLLQAIKKVVEEDFFLGLDHNNANYTHIIHDRTFDNLSRVLDTSKGDVIIGGERDAATRYIAPTVLDNVSWDDSSMQIELFGPILPILTYASLGEAITQVVRRHDTPLAQYVFTSGSTSRHKNKPLDQILKSVRSGAVQVNDVLMHVALPNAPFGGVGQSGLGGGYHGFFSFRAFTHERTTIEQKLWTDFAVGVRYPPYNDKKDKAVHQSLIPHGGRVWFNRTGDVRLNGPNAVWSTWTALVGVGALAYYFVGAL